MYVQIGLAILVLVTFVVAFFAARTWHWAYVLAVVGIVLSTVGFFVLSAEVLRVNAIQRTQVNNLQRQLAEVTAQVDALRDGSDDPQVINQLRALEVKIPEEAESIPSLSTLEHQLHMQTRNRGRVWRKVVPGEFDARTNSLTIGVESPNPTGIAAESVVFLFEEGEPQRAADDGSPRGPQFLGEFRVTAASGQQATLQPALPLDQFERQRLANSRGPWSMYEVMPADRYRIYAEMTEEQLREKLPSQSVDEYLRHGKDAGPDDDEWHRAGFDESGKRLPFDQLGNAAKQRYQRRLRDYALEFDHLASRRAVLEADREGVKRDIQRLQAALADGRALTADREKEVERLNTDLAGVTNEKNFIQAHLETLQRQLARAEQLLNETLRRNSEMARELAARQASTVEVIEFPPAALAPQGPLALDAVN